VQFLVFVLVRLAVAALQALPPRAAIRAGRALGRALRHVDFKHARIAAKNLERSRGVVPPDGIDAFIDRLYEHLGTIAMEIVMAPPLVRRGKFMSRMSLDREPFDRCLREGKGGIVVIGHTGNWEYAGLGYTLAGYPVCSLARPIENPWLDRWLLRFRTQTGQQIIPKYHALGEMIRVLKANKLLVVQVDQDARHSGVFVDFFGRPASTHRSPALLSIKYGAPVVMANIYRDGDLHRVELDALLYPDSFRNHPDPAKALTQAINDRLEEFIRAHPEQWFWVHDRWKTAERAARRDPALVDA
jgi:KDO2-lipid IV(A) lauroyltransferase